MDLNKKTVLFLGSSVTYGSAAGGISFADFMREQCKLVMVKEALSGTTLADVNDLSYVARLKRIDRRLKIQLCIVQLSTNDASQKLPLEQTESAIRFIADYVETTWGCPLIFYTGTYYDSEHYSQLIALLFKLQQELDFHILDLWNDPAMREVSQEDYKRYMSDPIHPTMEGYQLWWTPKFIDFCQSL